MYAAIDALADKLDRQVLKHKEKLKDHRYDNAAIAPAGAIRRRRRRPITSAHPTATIAPGPQRTRRGVRRPPAGSSGHDAPRPHEPDRRLAAGGQHRRSTSTSRRSALFDGRSGSLFEKQLADCRRRASSRQPLRAREAGLDRPRAGHRDSARPHQGLERGARRVRAPAHADRRSTRPTASRSQQVFVLLVPEQATDQHLQLLSELAQMFSERTFRERLRRRSDARTVARRLSRLATRRPDQPTCAERRCARSASSGSSTTTASGSASSGSPAARAATACSTGESCAASPTIGQVGHMNLIHPFRVQILGAAELALPARAAGGRAAAGRSTGCSPRSSSRSSSPTARRCRAHLLEQCNAAPRRARSPRRSRRRTSST